MYVVYVYLCNNIDYVCLKNKSSKAYSLKYNVSLPIVLREHNRRGRITIIAITQCRRHSISEHDYGIYLLLRFYSFCSFIIFSFFAIVSIAFVRLKLIACPSCQTETPNQFVLPMDPHTHPAWRVVRRPDKTGHR